MKTRRKVAVVSDHISGSKSASAVNVREMAKGFASLEDIDVNIVLKSNRTFLYTDLGVMEPENFGEVPLLSQHVAGGAGRLNLARLVKILAKTRPNFVYARSQNGALAAIRASIPFVLETHKPPGQITRYDSAFFRLIGNSPLFRGLVTISPILREAYVLNGVPADKVFIIADPVDTELFKFNRDLDETVTIPQRVFYAGHLMSYKGIETLLRAAKTLPSVEFRLAGGLRSDIARTRKLSGELGLSNVNLMGWLDRETIAREMRKSQLLCLPNEAWHQSANWTSPMKLGEYLATGNPMVVSDIPAHRYWLTNVDVNFFEAGNHLSLSQNISQALSAQHKKIQATSRRSRGEDFSLTSRIQKVLSLM